MRIHTDTLTAHDIVRSAAARGMSDVRAERTIGVHASLTMHRSLSRRHAFDVRLTGTSSRRPNGWDPQWWDDVHAATWDEWGMFLATLFDLDPNAIVGSVKHPIYAGREHFHAVTRGRFKMLTADQQHGRAGHRWDSANRYTTFVSGAADGVIRVNVTPCVSCDAETCHVDPAPYLSQLNRKA